MSMRALLAAALLTVVAGCGGDSATREVRLLAPAGYAEDGSTEPAADWIGPFERRTGCTVDLRVYDDDENVVAIARRRDVDAIAGTLEHFDRLREAGELLPVQSARIPAYRSLDAKLRQLFPGAVPHAWGDFVVLANFPFKGVPADMVPGAYQELQAVNAIPDSPLVLEMASLSAVRTYASRRDLWTDDVTAAIALRRTEAVAGIGRRAVSRLVPHLLMTVAPRTTPVGWATAWSLRPDGDNRDCAYRWIAYATSASVNARSAAYAGEEPANCIRRCRRPTRVRFPRITPAQRALWEELTSQ